MFSSTASTHADKLASLALGAATELDKLQRGSRADTALISEFLDELTSCSQLEEGGAELPLALDPVSSDMFSTALGRITKRPLDVAGLHSELARILRTWRKSNPTQMAGELRDFSLAIHEYILRARTRAALSERGVFDYDHDYTG